MKATKATKALLKIKKLSKPVRVIQGGQGAGKTYGVIPIIINKSLGNPGYESSIVTDTIPNLKKGAIRDFKKVMNLTGLWNPNQWHDTDKIYTFQNGSFIEFFSTDKADAGKGPRRNCLYVNEGDRVGWNKYVPLAARSELVFVDFNPTHEFWAHTELKNDPKADWLKLTYLDNEKIPENELEFLMDAKAKSATSKYWANYWQVYGLGELGSLDGVVFENVTILDAFPSNIKLLGYGMDFGYSQDPTTCMAVYQRGDDIFIKQEIYRRGLKTPEIHKLLQEHQIRRNVEIVAESADPRLIDELYDYGWNMFRAKKGPGSIMYGIDVMQRYNIHLLSEDSETIEEFRNYTWAKDKNGKTLNRPVDMYNHTIDAIRYLLTFALRNSGSAIEYDTE